MNIVHLIETHDMAPVDDKTSHVVSGKSLDDDYNQHILPALNLRK